MNISLLAFAGYLCIWLVGCVLHLIWVRDKIDSGFLRYFLDTFFNTWCLFIPLGFYSLGVLHVS